MQLRMTREKELGIVAEVPWFSAASIFWLQLTASTGTLSKIFDLLKLQFLSNQKSTLATLGIKVDKFLFENNEILFGSNNLNSASSSRIAAAVVHKDFDQMTLMHDIALVKLETAHILPTEDEVCIPENNWDIDTDFPFASEAFVAGYGVTSFGGFDKQTQELIID